MYATGGEMPKKRTTKGEVELLKLLLWSGLEIVRLDVPWDDDDEQGPNECLEAIKDEFRKRGMRGALRAIEEREGKGCSHSSDEGICQLCMDDRRAR